MIKRRHPPKPLHLNNFDVMQKESWKVFQIMSEFVEGFERLATIGPSVSIFGSARIQPDDPYYQMTVDIAQRLSDEGFSIVSGGGPGLMEAANKGAYQGKHGLSIGLNIQLPHEQHSNEYQDFGITFRHFFARKVMFVKHANAYVVMPGGFGTLDELAEILTLMQTKKSRKIPVVLVGSHFWQGLLSWMKDRMLAAGTIAEEDLSLLHIVDDVDAVLDVINQFYQGRSFEPTEEELATQRAL